MISFIDDHREVYGVEPLCKVLPIAPSTYHTDAALMPPGGSIPRSFRRGPNTTQP
jgi:putative transposase